MTLVDTSAWVEFLRATQSDVHHRLRELIESEDPVHTTDVVVMEVLAGGRDELHAAQLRRLMSRCEFLPLAGLGDYEEAAAIYRRCRRGGATIRSLTDCLIAAVAMRTGVRLLHADRDFEQIAAHSGLRLT